jgi:hypothetical protein
VFSSSENNSLAYLCSRLNLTETDVRAAFAYWASEGLVSVTGEEPLEVEYLPVSYALAPIKKFSKTKYADFNEQLKAVLPTRQILPNEYNEYYSAIEDLHMEPSAMLAVIAYCARLKGTDISSRYILTVARNFASKGLLTEQRVMDELAQYDAYTLETGKIMKALKSKKMPDHEDKNLFLKWTKNYGYKSDVIAEIAEKFVKKGDFTKLDRTLTKFYENKLFTVAEIEKYLADKDKLYELTFAIDRTIGVYYEQVDYIVENYVLKWINMGYAPETLKTIAEYCFKHNVRTIEGMNGIVDKFYRQGVVSAESFTQFVSRTVAADEEIKKIFAEANLDRNVTSRDRDAYRTWTYSWKMPLEVIYYAASLSKGASNPIAYMNTILSSFFSKNVDTLDKAKAQKISVSDRSENKVEKTYTSEQLNAIFDNISAEDL